MTDIPCTENISEEKLNSESTTDEKSNNTRKQKQPKNARKSRKSNISLKNNDEIVDSTDRTGEPGLSTSEQLKKQEESKVEPDDSSLKEEINSNLKESPEKSEKSDDSQGSWPLSGKLCTACLLLTTTLFLAFDLITCERGTGRVVTSVIILQLFRFCQELCNV